MNKIFLLLIVLVSACSVQNKTTKSPTPTPAIQQNQIILDSIITIAKQHSLYANKLDWTIVEKEMHRQLMGDSLTAIIKPVEYLFQQLGDFHGALFLNGNRYNSYNKSDYHYPVNMEVFNEIHAIGSEVVGQMLEENIAYLKIPHFYTANAEQIASYTQTVREKICTLKTQQPSGWIIDLRLNVGGNMYPMFAGLGEIFPNINLSGDSKDGLTYQSNWYNQQGNFHMWDSPMTDVSLTCNPEEKNINENTKVAVLIGRYTSSSGEAVASSFKGQANVKLIGEITSGWSSTTGWFPIHDEVLLVPTVAYFMSIDSTLHKDGIHPDELIVEELAIDALTTNKTIQKGVKWVSEK